MSIRVKLGGAWPRWVASRTYQRDAGLEEWEAICEEMFDATQEVVHVITGRLRSSGSVSVTTDSHGRFVGVVEYSAPYAAEEALRGGPHDYMQRGYEAVQGKFSPAVGRALERAVERAF